MKLIEALTAAIAATIEHSRGHNPEETRIMMLQARIEIPDWMDRVLKESTQ